MTWHSEWGGRATDFMPDNLKMIGAPGRLAHAAVTALWEGLQAIGNQDPAAWVRVIAHGEDDKANPGLGRLTVTIAVLGDEPPEVTAEGLNTGTLGDTSPYRVPPSPMPPPSEPGR